MKLPLTFVAIARLVAVTAGFSCAGCAGTPGKLKVDSPALPYIAPDISDITGIDEDDDAGSGSGSGSAATK